MTRICTCRSAEWHVEPCPDDLFLGALFSGAAAAIPVAAAASVSTAGWGAVSTTVTSLQPAHQTPGARRSQVAGDSARPDPATSPTDVPGPREDPAPGTAALPLVAAAVPTPRRRPFLTWLLDRIGRPA